MKLTGKHKIYLVVAGLGVLALILDRTVFSPEDARGGEREVHQDQSTTPPVLVGTAQGGSVGTEAPSTSQIADHLRHIAAERAIHPEDIRDAFHPGKSWFSDDSDQASNFLGRNKLIGVILGTERSYARFELLWKKADVVKHNRFVTLHVGDTLDAYILISLDSDSVVFDLEGEQVTLHLK